MGTVDSVTVATMVAVSTAVQNCPGGKVEGFGKFRG
jgi:hypothetical protein